MEGDNEEQQVTVKDGRTLQPGMEVEDDGESVRELRGCGEQHETEDRKGQRGMAEAARPPGYSRRCCRNLKPVGSECLAKDRKGWKGSKEQGEPLQDIQDTVIINMGD